MKKLVDVASGREKADLVLKNCSVIDVFSNNIIHGDVAICGEYIAGIGQYCGDNEVDLNGKYVMPGFIDAHVHIESSMVTPIEYAKAVLPNGVTTIVADPHEIANVCGVDGVEFMINCAKLTPLTVNFMVPSCVPATPFENSGAVIDSEKVKHLMKNALGLGEMMNYPGVISGDDEVLAKINSAKIIDGHAPNLTGNDLNAYLSVGIKTDHECTNIDEMNEKISKGIYVQIREGTLSRDLENLIGGVNCDNVSRCLFCTDDRYLGDITELGTINYCIKKAIGMGLNPIYAIKIATLNAASCYGFEKTGAVAPGYIADLVVADSLNLQNIERVYKKGKLVAENGKTMLDFEFDIDYNIVKDTVHLPEITAESFAFSTEKEEIPVIHINEGVITTTKVMRSPKDKGLSKVAVIERHKNIGTIGVGFAENYNIKKGAIASTIGHDSHNAAVIGDNDLDMAVAVNALGKSGGIVVCKNGVVIAQMELAIAGLISDKKIDEVIKEHNKLHSAAKLLDINPKLDPFMTLAFLPLPVIPEIRITDRGIFDVEKFEFIEV